MYVEYSVVLLRTWMQKYCNTISQHTAITTHPMVFRQLFVRSRLADINKSQIAKEQVLLRDRV